MGVAVPTLQVESLGLRADKPPGPQRGDSDAEVTRGASDVKLEPVPCSTTPGKARLFLSEAAQDVFEGSLRLAFALTFSRGLRKPRTSVAAPSRAVRFAPGPAQPQTRVSGSEPGFMISAGTSSSCTDVTILASRSSLVYSASGRLLNIG